jgi:Ca-activated chloride channel family protein
MNNLRHIAVLFSLLILNCSAVAQKKPATQEQDVEVLRINTNLVTVPVSVVDRQGRFIPGLKESQFHLYENGVEQKIAFFDNTESPFTVALMLDTSDSTRVRLGEIQQAALAFLDQLREDDRVLIACFDTQIRVASEITSNRQKLRDAILQAHTGGGTGLYDTFDAIVNQRLKKISGRKAIVMFTDGVDTSSTGATFQSTLYTAAELDALVFPIQYNTYTDLAQATNMPTGMQVLTALGERMNVAYERANRYLRSLSDKSGGRFYEAQSVSRLTEVFAAIAQELRQQYSIGYYPSDDGKAERAIKVKVDVPNVSVRARKAFRYRSSNERIDKQYSFVSGLVNQNRVRRQNQ